MPQALGGYLWMHVRAEQVGRVTVAQIMETDPTQAAIRNQINPFMRKAARLDRMAVCFGHYKVLRVQSPQTVRAFLNRQF
jgi:hypothetical protein